MSSAQDLTSSNEKQNALDAIPTSSTDANVTFAKTETAVEDPISSTSSEVAPAKCLEEEIDSLGAEFGVSCANMGQSRSAEQPKPSTLESEEEFLNMNMESNERITEDVEDIVHDLENLLGDSYSSAPSRSSETKKSDEDVNLALEELEELTRKEEPLQEVASLPPESETVSTVVEESQDEPVISPSVELSEAATGKDIPEEVAEPQGIESIESTNEEPEIVPDPPGEVSSVSGAEEADIHSTIREETEESPRKAQRIKLIRCPVAAVTASEETEPDRPQIEEISETDRTESTSESRDKTEIVVTEILDSVSQGEEMISEKQANGNEIKTVSSEEDRSLQKEEIVEAVEQSPSKADNGSVVPQLVDMMETDAAPEILPSFGGEQPMIVEKDEVETKEDSPVAENSDQVISGPSLIDELMQTAAMGTIEPIESSCLDPLPELEKLEASDIVESLELDAAGIATPSEELLAPSVEELEDVIMADSVPDEEVAGKDILEAESSEGTALESSEVAEQLQEAVQGEDLGEIVGCPGGQSGVELPEVSTAEKWEEAVGKPARNETNDNILRSTLLGETSRFGNAAPPREIHPDLKTTLTVDVNEQEPAIFERHEEAAKSASPKAVVKQESQHLLKITISKQADNTHSILKVCSPGETSHQTENVERIPKISIKPLLSPQDTAKKQTMSPTGIPKVTIKPIVKPESPVKLTIKPIVRPEEEQHRASPKLTIKPILKPDDVYEQQRASPKLTIKPIVKPDDYEQPKVTIKPIVKADDDCTQEPRTFEVAMQEQDDHQKQARSSPKITIKPIVKPEGDEGQKQKFSPKLTIKPIIRPDEAAETDAHHQKSSPKLTIKPIVKPAEEEEQQKHPKLTIKPIVRPEEQMPHSPKITIKPIVKPQDDLEPHCLRSSSKHADVTVKPVEDYEGKSHGKSGSKTDCPKVTFKPVVMTSEHAETEEATKQERIILKINKSTLPSRKREHSDEGDKGEKLAKIKVKYSKEGGHAHIVPQTSADTQPETEADFRKRFKLDDLNIPQGVTITNIEPGHSRHKNVQSSAQDVMDDVKIEPIERVDTSVFPITNPVLDPEMKDPLGDIPVFENVLDFAAAATSSPVTLATSVASPRRRGRPRKVPLEVREEFKDPPKEEPAEPAPQSTRPKRSCRGPSVRATLGIKPRKPRGPGRGRGGKRGTETRATVMKAGKEAKVSIPKLKLLKESIRSAFAEETPEKGAELHADVETKPPEAADLIPESRDVPIYEEETRMSADAGSSRAQTPAKQIPTPIADVVVEESQSSVQSSATTESAKGRRGPRLEVHQEPEGAIISADQLAEYSWGGGGPYMLQEQVAQFLGIKSFKRKYPGIQRRPVDMQERDFIRESGLASEAMCDLGLTAVNSADILDIMYSDFQPKYEEYCKHQRDRQAKDLTNKQKALTLAVSQEKNNLTEQAVQSAASWNSTFNKARREKRKACMDLQTFTIHYPKGKVKQIGKAPVGNYPVALVPGQFTDYFEDFTPTELNNLPLNTICYNTVNTTRHHEDDSQSDGSASDSDSSSSDSDSSESGSSEGENCTMCRPSQKQVAAAIH